MIHIMTAMIHENIGIDTNIEVTVRPRAVVSFPGR